MVILLIEAGYDDSTITLRTGHQDMRSLRSYYSLTGAIGLQQMARIFGAQGDADKKSRCAVAAARGVSLSAQGNERQLRGHATRLCMWSSITTTIIVERLCRRGLFRGERRVCARIFETIAQVLGLLPACLRLHFQ